MKISAKKALSARFSLVELLVVSSIFVLVAGITTVSIVPMMRGRHLRGGARTVQNALRQAKSYAAHSRRDTTVFFEYGGVEGLIEISHSLICLDCGTENIQPGADCPNDPNHETIPDHLFEAMELSGGVEFDDPPVDGPNGGYITFTPMGALENGTGVRHIDMNDAQQNQSIRITVIAPSGVVKVGEIQD